MERGKNNGRIFWFTQFSALVTTTIH
jgi:hypothetical protein